MEPEELEVSLPRMDIILNDVTLEEINENGKEVKYSGNAMSVMGNGAMMNFSDVEIKGRGNGTWAWDKKAYQIKLVEKTDLLGLGKARKWYLLANRMDHSNLRNDTVLMLSRMLGIEPTLKGRFVELSINGEYHGLYYLTQPLEISKNVLDLRDEMGVLVELDDIYGFMEEENYTTDSGDILTVKDAVNYDERGVAMELFLEDFNEMWQAIKERDFDKLQQIIDVESFVKYYLLSELIVNPDAYVTSCYFYKDGVENKIHAGPAWDFDLSLGNKMWGTVTGEEFHSPYGMMVRKKEAYGWIVYDDEGEVIEEYDGDMHISRIYFELMEMPEFREMVDKLYEEKLAGKKEEILAYFKSRAEELREYILRDNEKWEKWDFDKEVEYVVDWLSKRLDYFEYEYGGLKDLNKFSVEI